MVDRVAHPDLEPAVVVRLSRRRWAGVAAGCLGFVALGTVLLAAGAGAETWLARLVLGAFGLLALGFFGFGLVVGAAALVTQASRLEIDDEGFTIRGLGRSRRVAWRETPRSLSAGPHGVFCAVDADVDEGGLVAVEDVYEMTSAALAAIMNARRARAAAREGFPLERDDDYEFL
jgi:hypothetical protein